MHKHIQRSKITLKYLTVFFSIHFSLQSSVVDTGLIPVSLRGIGGVKTKVALDEIENTISNGEPFCAIDVRFRKSGQCDFKSLKQNQALSPSDEYNIRVFTEEGNYLYVFQFDQHGNLFLLFPEHPETEYSRGKNPAPSGSFMQIPGSNESFFLDENRGIETIVAVVSSTEQPMIIQKLVEAEKEDISTVHDEIKFVSNKLPTRSIVEVGLMPETAFDSIQQIALPIANSVALTDAVKQKVPVYKGRNGLLVRSFRFINSGK